jgi:hypothetical protein
MRNDVPNSQLLKTMQLQKIEQTYLKLAVLAPVLICCCLAISCGGCDEPRNIATSALSKKEQTAPPPSSNQLIVYLDTSASMSGYVATERGTETKFTRTLQELRNFVTLINPPLDVFVRRVDVQVGEPVTNMTLSQASVDKNLFNGADTDLAGAFDSFSKGVATAKVKGDDSASAPPRFHVLVTDGVQSTNQQRPDLACTAGSDQLCVRKKIFDLLTQGWGGCVIGLRSEFHGSIYSEINRAQKKPSVLRFDSDNKKSETFRPFYLFVFSPDRAALEPFAATLIDRLEPLVGENETSLRILPLTFQYADGAMQVEASVPPSATSSLAIRKKVTNTLPEFTIAIDPDTARKGPQPFTLTITVPWSKNVLRSGTLQEMAQSISWQLTPNYPEPLNPKSRYPEVKITGQQVDEAGHIVLQATAQWLPAVGDLCWRGYRLEGRLNPEALTPQWVRDWSTNLDTTVESANKTLYLETGLLGLWRNSVLTKQLVAEAYLVAGKR